MRADRLMSVFVVLFCIVSWVYLIPTYIKGEEQALYPRLVILFLALPALAMAARPRSGALRAGAAGQAAPEKTPFIDPMTLALVVLYLLYLCGVQHLGFFCAGFAGIIVFLLLFGERRPLALLGVPTGLLLSIHCVIERFLHFPLPTGLLF